MWRLYFQWNRLIEVLAYIFSMIYLIDDFQLDRTSFTIFKGSRQVESIFLVSVVPRSLMLAVEVYLVSSFASE